MVASYVQHCYRQSLFCDLVLEAESESIPCHKMVLFSVFPRFQQFLTEHSGDVIIFPEFPGPELRQLVNNIYWHLHERETSLVLPEGLRALGLFHESIDEHTRQKRQRLSNGPAQAGLARPSAALVAQLVKVKMEEAAQAVATPPVPPAATLIPAVPDPFTAVGEIGDDFNDTMDACEDFFHDALNNGQTNGSAFNDLAPVTSATASSSSSSFAPGDKRGGGGGGGLTAEEDEDFVQSFKRIRRMKYPERYGASGKRLQKAMKYEQEDEIVKHYPAVAKTLMESEVDLANANMSVPEKKKAMYDILQTAKRNWRNFIRGYKCDCDIEAASTFFQAEKHVTLCHSSRFSLCEMCDTIRLKEKIDKHKRLCRTFYEKDGNTCSDCGRQYKSRNELTNHISDAHKRVKCKICGEEIVGHGALQRHRQKLHPVLVQCDQCPMTFPSNFKLRTHQIRMHLPDSQKPFICDQCGKGFLYKRKLDEHMMYAHIRSFPMQCRFGCDKRFNDSNMRRAHEVRVHNAPSKKRG
ncbi:zinc finger protein 120-like [Tigriopus californicus]|nr:zinc finger protein 120-like [Tigriopus californicus]